MQISLGTGLVAGRRGPASRAPGAPTLVRPPALVGTGRIGAPLAAEPGDWAGAARFERAWLKNGAPIPGATGPVYVPVPADDRAALACRITAIGAAGRTVAETPAVAAAFAPPLAAGLLPDRAFPQGTGFHTMDISPFFSGDALTFSISGDGVSVDPATGLVTISAEALRAGAAIVVAAENSGGRAELGFTLRVTPPAVEPVLLRSPALAGPGLVGAELVVDPGEWAGDPAPELAPQWLCDGAPIAGATGPSFIPGDAEDGAEVAVEVTARNPAGTLAARTAPVGVVRAAPTVAGALADVTLAQGAAARDVPAAAAFAGEALRFAVAGAGARIDPETGVVTLPTGALRAGETVTVTATNSGGAATVAFAVTVRPAAPVLTAPVGDVTATVGAARTVDVGALVTPRAGLTWTSNRPNWGLSAAGVLTIPTGAAMTGTVANVTATDAFGQSVTATFRVTVVAPQTVTTAPTLAAAAAPGTALGSVWTVAGGAYAGGVAPFVVEQRFLRDGVAIAPFGAATSYAVVAADQGKTITAQVRRTDSAVPPQVLTVDVAGSAVIPAAIPPMTVTTAPTLAAAVAPGTALGSVWTVAGGAYAGGVAPFVTERRFLRDGVAIAAFGAATSYAVVAADQGKTITAQVRRTDSAVPPQVLTVDVAGSAVIPAAIPPLTVTAAPTFAPATAPGTAVGSVWSIAGGAYAGGVAPFVTERRFLRDGVAIAPFGAATSYAVVAADRGKTVTAQVRRTDSAVPPQTVTTTATGSAVIPGAVVADYVVNNTPELLAAMIASAAFTTPKTIVCMPGNYAALNRQAALVKGGGVGGINDNNRTTIVALNRNEGANARCRFLNNISNLDNLDGFTFDGFVFEATAKDAFGFPAEASGSLRLGGCKNITYRNCTFKGSHRCFSTQPVMVNFKVEWCEFTRIGMDGVSVFGDRNRIIKFHNNEFHDMDVDPARATSDTPNRHPDACSTQGQNNIDVEWLRNLFLGPQAYWQGIFCANSAAIRNNAGPGVNHQNVTISDNTVVTRHRNGIFIGGVTGLTAERNQVRTFTGTGPGTSIPNIVLGGTLTGVVRNNVMPQDFAIANQTSLDIAGLTRTNNTLTTATITHAQGRALHNFPVGPYGYEA